MTLGWYTTVIESRDPNALAHWWAGTLDWQVFTEDDREVLIVPPWADELRNSLPFAQVPAGMVFIPVEHDKPWDVLADPDGNEFCILSSREM